MRLERTRFLLPSHLNARKLLPERCGEICHRTIHARSDGKTNVPLRDRGDSMSFFELESVLAIQVVFYSLNYPSDKCLTR